MLVYRPTIAAAIFASGLLASCADPDLPTDLRKSGPPDVTTVTVMSDLETASDPSPAGLGRIVETATYCRLNDEKRPGLVGLPDIRTVQVCPDDLKTGADDANVAAAAPPTWFARVVFDELLDPNIEDLVPQLDSMGKPTGITLGTLKNTQPVTLKCEGVDVPYDGYYVPNGNRNSWPVGPSLFIQPTSSTSVPTGATCTVSVKDKVHNKRGEQVPSDQRGDYTFKLAGMVLRFTSLGGQQVDNGESDIADGSLALDPAAPVDFFWTAAIKTVISPTDILITAGDNLNVSATNPDGDPNPAVCNGTGAPLADPLQIHPTVRGTGATTTALVMRLDLKGGPAPEATAWKPNTTYLVKFGPNAKVVPTQGIAAGAPSGAPPASFALCFHTTAGS